ncbi:MAG: helix-turn-helix transcriptional regulator [Pseudonocardiaceae bacterium]
MTQPLVRVAMALMTEPMGRHWGYELFKRSGVRSGALYPMLTRLLDEGWLTDGWEDRAAIRDKRPARRYYELTDKGRRELGAVVQKARREPRFEPVFTAAAATGQCSASCGSFARGWRGRWAVSFAGRWA